MELKKTTSPDEFNASSDKGNGTLSFKMDLPKEDYITCDICGHKNPKSAGLCEMCSAYLFKQ